MLRVDFQGAGRRTGPFVDFGRTFADFKQGALGQEHRHDLLIECAEKNEEHENRVKLVDEALDRTRSRKAETNV